MRRRSRPLRVLRVLRLHQSLGTSLLLVLSLLFSQLALAGYVCPRIAQAPVMQQHCDGMDMEQPQLCAEHAKDPAAQPADGLKLPLLPLPALVQVLALPPVLVVGPAAPASPVETRPPPEPLFLATLRLRV